MVVAEGADLVGVLTQDRLTTNRARPASFVMDQWTRALASREIGKPDTVPKLALQREGARKPLTEADEWKVEDAMEAAGKSVATGGFLCSGRDWCIGKLTDGLLIATFSDFAFQGAACRQAQIVIAASFLREPRCGTGEGQLFDRNALRQRGALAIYLEKPAAKPPDNKDALRPPEQLPIPAYKVVGALDGQDRPWLRHRYYNWRSNSYGDAYSVE